MNLRMSIKARLIGVLGLLAAIAAGLGVLGIYESAKQHEQLEQIDATHVAASQVLGQFNTLQRRTIQVIQTAILARDPAQFAESKVKLGAAREQLGKLWEQYEATNPPPQAVEMGKELWRRRTEAVAINNAVMTALSEGRFEDARVHFLQDSLPKFEPLIEITDELSALQMRLSDEAVQEAQRGYNTGRTISIAIIVVAMAIAGAFAYFLTRLILTRLGEARRVARQIASGELGKAVASSSNDEFGELLNDLHAMDRKLVEVVGDVREGANSVGSAATELSHGNDDLSQRTQEQAAALEETAASMEQMTSTVNRNADNARQANQLAASARLQAEKGGHIVQDAVAAMEQINESSRRVGDIIGVIDEIAFQTNLLALNAAVEAARAGDLGRGFAVVASEVRNLAQRSASAAKETKDLITQSLGKVTTGAELVGQSGRALQEIIDSIRKVSDVVGEISAASDEQSRGIEQVNNAVTQMDTTTQQNAALVEEAAAASKAMQQQAERLVQGIAFFSVQQGAASRAVAAPAPVVPMKRASTPPSRTVRPARSAHPPAAKVSGDETVWQEF